MKSKSAPTIQQLTSYKLGKDGLRVKLNEEGIRNIWDIDEDMTHVQGEYYIEMVNYDNNSLQLVSSENIKYSLDEIDLSWIELQLKPLSLLKSEIEFKGEKLIPIEWLEDKYYTLDLHKQCQLLLDEDGENWINQSEFMLVEHLIEWEFDIYGLNL